MCSYITNQTTMSVPNGVSYTVQARLFPEIFGWTSIQCIPINLFWIPRLICSALGAGERESRSASPTEEMKAITLHPFFLITCGERARDTGDGRWGRPRGILGETEGSRAPSWSDSDTLTHPIVHSRRHGWETSHETCERLRCWILGCSVQCQNKTPSIFVCTELKHHSLIDWVCCISCFVAVCKNIFSSFHDSSWLWHIRVFFFCLFLTTPFITIKHYFVPTDYIQAPVL